MSDPIFLGLVLAVNFWLGYVIGTVKAKRKRDPKTGRYVK